MDIVMKVIEGFGEAGRDTTVDSDAQFYVKLYNPELQFDMCGYETLDEAIQELEYAVKIIVKRKLQ